MSYVDPIISAFGGVRALARLGEWPVSTVKSWKDRGSIPDAQKADVLRVAIAIGLDLRPEHFFPHAPMASTDTPQPEADAA